MLSQYMGFGILTNTPYIKQCRNGEVAFITLAVKREYTKNKYDILHFTADRHHAQYIKNYLQKGDILCVRAVPYSRTISFEGAKRKYVTATFKILNIDLICRKDKMLINDSGGSIFPEMFEFSDVFLRGSDNRGYY